MKIKLTQNQVSGFHILLSHALKLNQPTDMASKLLFEIVDGINDKLSRKLKKLERSNAGGYSLALTSIESKALFCWLTQIEGEFEEDYQYECLVARNVVMQIDQVYA
jgi:hypothetical protein